MLLRTAPQDLPASARAMMLLGALMFVTSAMQLAAVESGHGMILPAVIDVLFLAAFVKVILALFRFPMRFMQTFTAFAGIHAGFGLAFAPLHYLNMHYVIGAREAAMQGLVGAIAFAYLALFVWSLRVMGHIFVHALETRLPFAIGIALLYLVGNFIVSAMAMNV